MIRYLILTIASLSFATPALAQVMILAETADLETSATSGCPADPAPEPDFQKYFVDSILDTDTHLLSEVPSQCGFVQMGAWLAVTRESSTISGRFGASSWLHAYDGGYGSLAAGLQFTVEQNVTYTLSCTGATTQTGEPHAGSMGFSFKGGAVDHTSDGEADFDHTWSGTLQPGVVYSLSMGAYSSRSVRSLPGGVIIDMDGETAQEVSFTLMFDDQIVDAGTSSIGQVKQRY